MASTHAVASSPQSMDLTSSVRSFTPGCCFSLLKSEFRHGRLDGYHKFCGSSEFSTFVSRWGLKHASFERNPNAVPGRKIYDGFLEQIESLPDMAQIAIVFHGTSKTNVPNILIDGLDPSLRRGQAYGPGEYFSKDPGLSLSYCRGGSEMLVFLVVIPLDHDKGVGDSKPRTYSYSKCPPEVVVVQNNAHQLPLGILTFGSVDQTALRRSEKMKKRLQSLALELEEKRKLADESMLKASIIQWLINRHIDTASEKYNKGASLLSQTSKREISMYVHHQIDEEVVDYYFPGLPSPMSAQEHDKTSIQSVETLNGQVSKAKERLEKEQEAFVREEEGISRAYQPGEGLEQS